MRRAVIAARLLALAAAAPAGAQDLLPPPTAEDAPARIARGGALDLKARSAAPPGSVMIRISGTPRTDYHGRLHGPQGTWTEHVASPTADATLHECRPDPVLSAPAPPRRIGGTGPAAAAAEDAVGQASGAPAVNRRERPDGGPRVRAGGLTRTGGAGERWAGEEGGSAGGAAERPQRHNACRSGGGS